MVLRVHKITWSVAFKMYTFEYLLRKMAVLLNLVLRNPNTCERFNVAVIIRNLHK